MSKLAIAICGPNMELNESLTGVIHDLLYSDTLEQSIMRHPMERIAAETGREEFDGHDIDWMNLWSSSCRRVELEGLKDKDVIISSSCGIDQLCYQAAWLGDQMEREKVGLSLVDASGNPIDSGNSIWINRSGSVLQVLLNSTEEEVFDYWDFIYAVLPVEVELSAAQAPLLVQYQDFLGSVPVFEDVIRLPDNLDAASDALKNEVEKWQTTLHAS